MRAVLIVSLFLVASILAADPIWSLCPKSETNTLQIKDVVILPAIPVSGSRLNVTILGVLSKAIKGGNIHVKVEYAGIGLFEGDLDVCEAFDHSLHCPVNPTTQFRYNIVQDIPPIAPPGGPYTGVIDISDQDKARVTCLNFKFEMQASQNANTNAQEKLNLIQSKLRNLRDAPYDLLQRRP